FQKERFDQAALLADPRCPKCGHVHYRVARAIFLQQMQTMKVVRGFGANFDICAVPHQASLTLAAPRGRPLLKVLPRSKGGILCFSNKKTPAPTYRESGVLQTRLFVTP